jgi:hypothetical protein
MASTSKSTRRSTQARRRRDLVAARSQSAGASSTAAARAEMEGQFTAVLTEATISQWMNAHGLDLTRRDAMLDYIAVGATVMCWRNTHLENTHAGEMDDPESCEMPAGLTGVAAPAERERLERSLALARAGHGIPEDVMLRLNTATVMQVREVLDRALPGDLRELPEEPSTYEDLPGSLLALYELLGDPGRVIPVGCTSSLRAVDVFDDWGAYVQDLDSKWGRLLHVESVVGMRRLVCLLALIARLYSPSWFPQPGWAPAMAQLRADAPDRTNDASARDADARAEGSQWSPNAQDDEFWEALTVSPWRLNGVHAWWLIATRTRLDFLRATNPTLPPGCPPLNFFTLSFLI